MNSLAAAGWFSAFLLSLTMPVGCAPPSAADCDLESGDPTLSGAWTLTLDGRNLGILTVDASGSLTSLRDNPDVLQFFDEDILQLDCALHPTASGMRYRAYGESGSAGDSVWIAVTLEVYAGGLRFGDMTLEFDGARSTPSRVEGAVNIEMNIPGFGDSIAGFGVATRLP